MRHIIIRKGFYPNFNYIIYHAHWPIFSNSLGPIYTIFGHKRAYFYWCHLSRYINFFLICILKSERNRLNSNLYYKESRCGCFTLSVEVLKMLSWVNLVIKVLAVYEIYTLSLSEVMFSVNGQTEGQTFNTSLHSDRLYIHKRVRPKLD